MKTNSIRQKTSILTKHSIATRLRSFTLTCALTLGALFASATSASAADGTILEIVVYDYGNQSDASAIIAMIDTAMGSQEFREKYDLTQWGLPPLPGSGPGEAPTEKPNEFCDRFVTLAQATASKAKDLDRFFEKNGLSLKQREDVLKTAFGEIRRHNSGSMNPSNLETSLFYEVNQKLRSEVRQGRIGIDDYNDRLKPGARELIQNPEDSRDLSDRAKAMLEAAAECKKSNQ